MKKYLPTVTVAVSALDEEANIVNFLKSILMQKEEGFVLKQIWVHSDGSTDKTVPLARSLKSNKIKVWDHKVRTGKSTWLNHIYQDLDTDFLVQPDADIVFAHEFVIRDLIQPLIKDKKVGMSGGNPRPLKGKTFWEKMCYVAAEPYQEFRQKVRGGNNPLSAVGQLLAFRNELVKKITVPADMIVNDTFTYFCCITMGWKYRYVKSAVVLFQPPQEMKDIIKQNTRFLAGYYRMFQHFPKKLVQEEMHIPTFLYFKTIIKHVIKHPILAFTYFVINKYAIFKGSQLVNKINAQWSIALTTKKLVGKLI